MNTHQEALLVFNMVSCVWEPLQVGRYDAVQKRADGSFYLPTADGGRPIKLA